MREELANEQEDRDVERLLQRGQRFAVIGDAIEHPFAREQQTACFGVAIRHLGDRLREGITGPEIAAADAALLRPGERPQFRIIDARFPQSLGA